MENKACLRLDHSIEPEGHSPSLMANLEQVMLADTLSYADVLATA